MGSIDWLAILFLVPLIAAGWRRRTRQKKSAVFKRRFSSRYDSIATSAPEPAP
jgi:hypothetical protein